MIKKLRKPYDMIRKPIFLKAQIGIRIFSEVESELYNYPTFIMIMHWRRFFRYIEQILFPNTVEYYGCSFWDCVKSLDNNEEKNALINIITNSFTFEYFISEGEIAMYI